MLLALFAGCDVATEPPLRPDAPPDVVPIDAPQQEHADWTVDCNGGGDFATIGEAIDAAADGDWIAVEPCTYAETVDFSGKSVWISSTEGSQTTTIDAGADYGVVAALGEGDGAALVGFTIVNGGNYYGTVYAALAALRLEDVVIRGSRGGAFVIYGTSADLELVDVRIEDSDASYYTLYMMRGAFVADGLEASCRGGYYAFHAGHGSFFLNDTELSCPGGYAIENENSVGRVHRSTLVGAVSATTDEDHYGDVNQFENTVLRGSMAQTYGTLVFRNSLLENGTITASDVFEVKLEASVFQNAPCAFSDSWSGLDTAVTPERTVEYNDFWAVGAEGCGGTRYSGSDGNLAADPQFTDAAAGDYTTDPSSPLVDAGLEESAYDDPDGTRNDIGLYGGPRSLGGGW